VLDNLRISWLAGRRLVSFEERVEKILQLFPQLRQRTRSLAADLSGGQRQMLAISRGLATDPQVLLLDEPTAGLAPVLILELTNALARLRDEGLTMLLVEQNVRVATRICECISVMSGGQITWQGEAAMLGRDVATKLYLGEDAAGGIRRAS
jgi:ABC-type branched-subunit amino acid transport system ATPase component